MEPSRSLRERLPLTLRGSFRRGHSGISNEQCFRDSRFSSSLSSCCFSKDHLSRFDSHPCGSQSQAGLADDLQGSEGSFYLLMKFGET
ncbi:hypothetical protein D9M68_956250 [compost metagenome]